MKDYQQMNEKFWELFLEHVDGKFIDERLYAILLNTLRDFEPACALGIGDGWTGVDQNGTFVSKQELIFIGNEIIKKLVDEAPNCRTWEIVYKDK